jgi:hypothetical protein
LTWTEIAVSEACARIAAGNGLFVAVNSAPDVTTGPSGFNRSNDGGLTWTFVPTAIGLDDVKFFPDTLAFVCLGDSLSAQEKVVTIIG